MPGPSIQAMVGVKTYIKWENHLPNQHIFTTDSTLGEPYLNLVGVPTVVHLHGSISEPGSDGNALSWFTRSFRETGPKWTKHVYEYENSKGTVNMWYHDHAMAYTRLNLLAGLIGAYKVVNPALELRTWKLPRERFDVQLVVMDRSFTKNGQIYINSTGDNPNIHPEWQVNLHQHFSFFSMLYTHICMYICHDISLIELFYPYHFNMFIHIKDFIATTSF